ncbi:hypothetical protein NDU88_001412, partial [Pleurodeles waltl]
SQRCGPTEQVCSRMREEECGWSGVRWLLSGWKGGYSSVAAAACGRPAVPADVGTGVGE